MFKKQYMPYLLLTSLMMMSVAMSPLIIEQIQPSKLAGIFEGHLNVGSVSLRVVFNVSEKNDSLFITMDSPDQGAKGIPTDHIILKNDSLTFLVPSIGGKFSGKISLDANTIGGVWMQGPAKLPIAMKRIEKVVELNRPQTPKRPFPYVEEEVSYRNTKDNITLAGTLTIPEGEGSFPAVILITGSGPQDRDESLLGHKPFLVISDYLTRRGIAVLRVDDRGVGGTSGKNWSSTTENFATDVLSGVDFLKSHKKISKKKIGLLGHSEGGIVAPLVASQSKDIAFIVMLAGTGMNGEEIIQLQSELISRANGEPESELQQGLRLNAAAIKLSKMNLDSAAEKQELRKAVKEFIASLPDSSKATMKNPIEEIEGQTRMFFTPWMRFFLTYDPRIALRKVQCAVLAVNGEKDLQVPPKQNLGEIEKALKEGKNKNYTIKTLPELNHLFQHSVSGSPMEYGKIEETIAPEALQLIGDWIEKQTK